jgi:mono/diheme cytochrome c family protein
MRRIVAVVAILTFVVLPALAEGTPTGKDLYDKKCAMCHGADGVAKAMGKGSANLNDPAWQAKNSVDAIVQVTTDGKKDTKMPGYKDKMSAADIKAVAEYIKTLK